MKKRSDYNFLTILSPTDIGTLFYIFVSTIFICIQSSQIENVCIHFAIRIAVIAFIPIFYFLDKRIPNKITSLLKNIYPLLFLSYFYGETVYIKNIIFPTDLDAHFAKIDQWLFDCQPSMEFSRFFNSDFFREIMFMSYFSYYLMIAIVCIAICFLKPFEARKSLFLVTFSFYMYYILYIILPIIGPQYYFNSTAYEPNLPYFFGKVMYHLHPIEKATGAFPSSHVGIAFILSYITFKHIKKLFYFILPFVFGICFATIYLKEHYLIDVIAGIISVPLLIKFTTYIYKKLSLFLEFEHH